MKKQLSKDGVRRTSNLASGSGLTMMSILKHMGITPLLPNRQLPGAGESDCFAGSWEIRTKFSTQKTQQTVNLARPSEPAQESISVSAVTAQKKLAEQQTTSILTQLESAQQSSRQVTLDNVQQHQTLNEQQHLQQQPAELKPLANKLEAEISDERRHDENADVAAAKDKESNSAQMAEQAMLSGDDAVTANKKQSFTISIFKHSVKDILVLAEIESNSDSNIQLKLLKKILYSFTRNDHQHWQQGQFRWPLAGKKVLLDSEPKQAQEMFLGYIEGQQTQLPKTLLCFSGQHLARCLDIDSLGPEEIVAIRFNHALWAEQENRQLLLAPSLLSLSQSAQAKAQLWEYIKQHFLSA